VLPLQGVAGCTKTERKDFLASASAMQRPLYSGLRTVSLSMPASPTLMSAADLAFFPGLRTALIAIEQDPSVVKAALFKSKTSTAMSCASAPIQKKTEQSS
jgi:hypothetical protein